MPLQDLVQHDAVEEAAEAETEQHAGGGRKRTRIGLACEFAGEGISVSAHVLLPPLHGAVMRAPPLLAAGAGTSSQKNSRGMALAPFGSAPPGAVCCRGTRHESALLARQTRCALRHGARSASSRTARRHRQGDDVRDLRFGPAPVRRLHADDEDGRHPRARVHGRGGRGRLGTIASSRSAIGWWCRSPSAAASATNASAATSPPASAPTATVRWPIRCSDTPVRTVRLHPPHRRLSRRPGRIRARAVRRCRTGQDARRLERRAGAVPRRHPAHRLAGRGAMRHRAHRHRRDVGCRPGRAVRDAQRGAAGRTRGGCHRPCARASGHGRGRRRLPINFEKRACSIAWPN